MMRRTLNRRRFVEGLGAGTGLAVLGSQFGQMASARQASPAAGAASTPTGELLFGKAQEAVGLDPALVTADASFQILAIAYDQLVQFNEKFEAQPMLAEKWETPNDTTFVFHLRPGVKFHNGRAMSAADVKYSLERIMDPKVNSPWLSQLEPVAAIDAVDDQTVKFTLKRPFGPFLSTLTAVWAAIVPKEEVARTGDLQKTIVGTGPFKLAKYTQDTETDFVANPDYWEPGLPKLAKLTYKILPDEASRFAALRTGQIQMTTLSDPATVKQAGSTSNVQLVNQDTTDYYLLGLNCKKAPYDNAKVRQALSAAIDRNALLEAVFLGAGKVTGPIVPTLGKWASPVDSLPYYKPDQNQAKQLLKEANLGDGFTLNVLASPLYPEFINIALVLQQQLKPIGIDVKLEQVEWGTFIDRWKKRDFDTFVSYNGSGNDPDRALYPAFHTDGSVNAFQFSDPNVDKLLDQGRETVSDEARLPIYQQVEKALAEAAPAIFLFTRTAHYGLRDNVKGFAPNAASTWSTLADTTVGS